MIHIRTAWSVLPVLLACAAAQEPQSRLPTIRLVPLADGLLDTAPQRDLSRHAESDLGKLSAQVGLDLLAPPHPLFAAKVADGRLFYVFFKTTENAFGERAWLLQRIRKIERTWGVDGGEPEEKTTFQIEAFKVMNGALKRPDQHHASFALRGAARREVVKEYEIGFGALPGKADGDAWPFASERLFEVIQPYQDAKGCFDDVVFTRATKWRLTAGWSADGTWHVTCPELGIDAPAALPDPTKADPAVDAASRDVVLERGKGTVGARVGETKAVDLAAALGQALEDVPTAKGSRGMSFPRSLSANIGPDGVLHTLITRPGFAGRTDEGIRHRMTRAEVAKLLAPGDRAATAESWSFPGLIVDFDAGGRVRRLVVTRNG